MEITNSSTLKGLGRYLCTPRSMAEIADSMLGAPVINTKGTVLSKRRTASSNDSPVMSGMHTSDTMTS